MKRSVLTIILLFITLQAQALITRPVTDHVHIDVPIALNNMTQIGVMGSRISQAIGMYDGSGPNTMYELKADNESGNVFITPEARQPFTLIFKTEANNFYSVTFHPTQMQAETILLVPQFYKAAILQAPPVALPYETAVTNLIRAMVTGSILQDYAVQQLAAKPVMSSFNSGISLLPVTFYQGANLSGKVYQIRNNTRMPVVLNENFFASPSIAAVALASHTLMPTETTWLYEVTTNAT